MNKAVVIFAVIIVVALALLTFQVSKSRIAARTNHFV